MNAPPLVFWVVAAAVVGLLLVAVGLLAATVNVSGRESELERGQPRDEPERWR